ncbi:hypothetical protein [Acinetobacter sp. ANC 4648]|uniref:hypothetical protein n=1 Tax=Acinetobacter sp. ANC 4648 TaxID=1977875 RepID=UPI000A33E326|nr:hypothetical protein [Acinetobacter sp. ANC 4648]OTG81639.1 hypothetical protein B9T27_10225 [Acinetobacter sp. ANC 4648]
MSVIKILINKSIGFDQVKADGMYTLPKTYGVYQLPLSITNTKRYRFGNHPIRLKELIAEFGSCEHYQVSLFLDREDAKNLARLMTQGE